MSGLRDAEVSQKQRKLLAMTSLTVEEFDQLVPAFEEAFEHRMKEGCLDGQPRIGRAYRTAATCPLPTPEERLLANAGLCETECLASGTGRTVRQAPKESPSRDPHLLAGLASPTEQPGRGASPLNGALGPTIGTPASPRRARGTRGHQPRASPPCCHDGTQRRIQRPKDADQPTSQ
jgi:hypothetical protein